MATRPVPTRASSTANVALSTKPSAKAALVTTPKRTTPAFDALVATTSTDISSLITLVMMEVSKAEEANLRSLLDELRATAERRREMRRKIGDIKKEASMDIDGAFELTAA